jgi:hypothetical protein
MTWIEFENQHGEDTLSVETDDVDHAREVLLAWTLDDADMVTPGYLAKMRHHVFVDAGRGPLWEPLERNGQLLQDVRPPAHSPSKHGPRSTFLTSAEASELMARRAYA